MSCNGIVFFMFCGLFTICATKKYTIKPKNELVSNSYSTIPGQFKKCIKPSMPYIKPPIAELNMEIKNGTIKGNLTILKDNISTQVYVQDFYYEDGKWQLSFYVNNSSCRTNFLAALARVFGFNYNKKTCSMPKGVHLINVDYNLVDRIWIGSRRTGRMMQRVEIYTKSGTIVCYELESIVVKKKD